MGDELAAGQRSGGGDNPAGIETKPLAGGANPGRK